MFLKIQSTAKFTIFALLCGFLAACQTSGLKPGSIQSSYAPSGWTKKSSNGITGYVCAVPRCKSDRAIGYGPIRVSGNFEQGIKNGEASKELFNAVFNVYNVASKGQEKLTITRKVVNKNYAGFDFKGYFPTKRGRIWIKGRLIVQDNRGSVLFSMARSQGLANTYFRKYMGSTTIKRLP
jgi:hypothetical protein